MTGTKANPLRIVLMATGGIIILVGFLAGGGIYSLVGGGLLTLLAAIAK